MKTLSLFRDSFEKEFITIHVREERSLSTSPTELEIRYPRDFYKEYDTIAVTSEEWVGPPAARISIKIVTTYHKTPYDDLYYKLKVERVLVFEKIKLFEE